MAIINHRLLLATKSLLLNTLKCTTIRPLAATFLSGMGTVLTLVSIQLLLNVVQGMKTGGGISIGIDKFNFVENLNFFVATGMIGLIAIIAAVFQYFGEKNGLITAQKYINFTRDVLGKVCGDKRGDSTLSRLDYPTVGSAINVISRESSLAVVQLSRIPIAILTAVGCLLFMATISVKATFIILLISPIYIFFLGKLNKKSEAVHVEYIELVSKARLEFAVEHKTIESANPAKQKNKKQTNTPATTRSDAIMFERIELIRRIGLLNSSALAILIVTVFILVSFNTFGTELHWAVVIIFLVLLRFAFGSLRQIAIATNVISRFLPSIEAVNEIYDSFQHPQAKPIVNHNDPPLIVAVLTNRVNRISAIKGAKLLASVDARLVPGTIDVRLDDYDGPREGESSVAHDGTVLAANSCTPPKRGVLLIVARSVFVINKLSQKNMIPAYAVDLRVDDVKVSQWSDVVDSEDSTPEENNTGVVSDDIDHLVFE